MASGNVIGPYVGRITKVPAQYIDRGADVFTGVAQRNGGSMMGQRLRTAVDHVSISDDHATATVYGTPAGPWSIAESGAKAHMIRPRARILAGALRHPVNEPVRHPGFAGEDRWTNTVSQVEGELAQLAQDLAGQAAA